MICHYANTRGHQYDAGVSPREARQLSRATYLRETTRGDYVPVCDACAELPSFDVLETVPLTDEYRDGYREGRDAANEYTDELIIGLGDHHYSAASELLTTRADRYWSMVETVTAGTYGAGWCRGWFVGLVAAARYHAELNKGMEIAI